MGLDQFRFDSIELQPTHLRLVSHLARRIVASWRTARPIGVIYLVGHTDVRGTNAYNQALGLRRASAIQSALAAAVNRLHPGLAQRLRFVARSAGSSRPLTASRSPVARSRNRRVSVHLRTLPLAVPAEGASPAAAVPSLLYTESAPLAQTIYVEIPLGGEGPARTITGIFLPEKFSQTPEVDVILYLHGHHKYKPYPPSLSIDDYWNRSKYPNFSFREGVNAAGKKTILVAPTLGPSSQAGKLMDAAGLSWYLDQVLAALKAHGPYKPADPVPVLGNLVLACHSGGGKPMRALALRNQQYADKIVECWGFDCLYHDDDPDQWKQWAQSNPAKKLFIYFGNGGTADRARSLKAKAAALSNVVVEGNDTLDHNQVPKTYWFKRLKAL